MTDGLQHAPDLAMAALMYDDADLGATRVPIAGRRPQHLNLSGRAHPAIELHARPQCLDGIACRNAGGHDLVLLRDLVPRMRQPVREVAVIHEEKQPSAVGVQPADGKDSVPQSSLRADHVEDCGPRRFVFRGGDHTYRLVEHEITVRGGRLDQLAVDRDAIRVGVDHESGCGRPLSIDADGSRGDQRIGRAAAGHAGAREIAIQPFARCGTSVSLLGVGRCSSDSRPITWRNRIVVP